MALKRLRLLFMGISLLFAHTALAQQYSLTVRSEHPRYEARAINAAGQVVGNWGTYVAFLWNDGTVQDLAPLPGTSSCQASAINDAGQVVGSCSDRGSVLQSFLWTADTGTTALPVPGWSEATGINNQGHIVGWHSDPVPGAPRYAFLYRDGVVEDLGLGVALGINDSDQVVGYIDDETRGPVARLWDADGPHDLDDEGGSSVAHAIRADGVIAGEFTRGAPPSEGLFHAVLWTPYGVSDLGTLRGGYSRAWAISGDLVVGESDGRAFVYDTNGPGFPVDLNDLISSSHRLLRAAGINAAGQIVGVADCCGESEAFLLTPVQPQMTPR